MNRRKLVTLCACAVILAFGGCKPESTSTAKGEAKSVGVGTDADEKDVASNSQKTDPKAENEQIDGAAAEAADEITLKHQEESPSKSVEHASIEGTFIQIPQAEEWILKESETDGEGYGKEVYLCDEETVSVWERSKAEAEDVEEGLTKWLDIKGWSEMNHQKEAELTEALGTEVYSYEANGEEDGYSMMQIGVYFLSEGNCYTVDFSVIEGSLMEYYDIFQGWIQMVELKN